MENPSSGSGLISPVETAVMRCKSMERWGSSYLLHDAESVRLVATLGSSTDIVGTGTIYVSFVQEPVFAVTRNGSRCELVVKWDVALRLMALVHVLVLQNKLLRGEAPEIRGAPDRAQVFEVTGGLRSSPIVCSWDASTAGVEFRPVHEGMADPFELVMKEEAAVELVLTLAERIAHNGTTMAREGG
ncbi:hypothetical protein [Polyangium mundeleinium]|uniref:Uncharacterized protein n=1 Tax=Polyangium mundeleinium TaxID=2995306 RepID=A0ABT5EX48_9BACT|nr:hypothetical protein [Polyangium mundeleinium]MDC0746391.1 hypothetical protein [Polyangium mundeleinium]